MKRSKILVVGLIGLLMAGGLVLAGCDEDTLSNLAKCPKKGECKTGLGGVNNSCGKNTCEVEIYYPSSIATCNCPS